MCVGVAIQSAAARHEYPCPASSERGRATGWSGCLANYRIPPSIRVRVPQWSNCFVRGSGIRRDPISVSCWMGRLGMNRLKYHSMHMRAVQPSQQSDSPTPRIFGPWLHRIKISKQHLTYCVCCCCYLSLGHATQAR